MIIFFEKLILFLFAIIYSIVINAMKKITLIRHAESIFNSNDKYDVPNCGLTENGILQANNLTFYFDCILISPLKRSLDTFMHSNIQFDEFIITNLVREHKTNKCDFFEYEDFVAETEEKLTERIDNVKLYIKSLPYVNIGIITHADFIFYFTSKIIDGERYGQWLKNTESYELFI